MVSPPNLRMPGRGDPFSDLDHKKQYSCSHSKGAPSERLDSSLMNDFGVLTNRKRAVIALIHSFVFLGVALHGFWSPKAGVLRGVGVGDLILVGIYLVVTSILTWLVGVSRCARERIYFALCASSATFGLLRTILGDGLIPAAQYLRVIMLSFAVAVGLLIVRSYAGPVAQRAVSE